MQVITKLMLAASLLWATHSVYAGEFQLAAERKDNLSAALSDADRLAIEVLISRQNEGFQQQDAALVTENVADSSNFVNQSGRLYWGKEKNLARHKKVFSPKAGDHLLASVSLSSKLVKWSAYGNPANTVIVVTRYQFSNHDPKLTLADYDPQKPTTGLFTTVLNKSDTDKAWQIISMQNTPTLPAQLNE
ncbi:hypothetical protein [Parendozoicomonas sp. Alg238-R29]|uniref:hypothetical protein n=1 Tax=Parendozoicomonas sp. Alg238-R29 TaxID=2993446 RepID=UPI00248EC0A9|nr:hypothetical protein [Parendozoicomonas sp. Alg238-R29]